MLDETGLDAAEVTAKAKNPSEIQKESPAIDTAEQIKEQIEQNDDLREILADIAGEKTAEEPEDIQAAIIDKLYEGIKPDESTVTAREPDQYKRVLGLDKVPLLSSSRVLDVGSGNANIKASDFDLPEENIVRIDMSPQNPDVQEGNVLDIPFDDERFDEAWATFVLKYVDHRLPSEVVSRLQSAIQISGSHIGAYTLVDNYSTFQGIKAVSELLRVVKPGGRVRVASYLYDFEQGETLKNILDGVLSGRIPGLTITGTEVQSSSSDPQGKEANIFLEKGKGYNQDKFNEYVVQEFQRLVPRGLAQAILQPAVSK